MGQDKNAILLEQRNKINDVISALTDNFSEEDVTKLVNFGAIVRDSLKELAGKL